MTILNEKSNFLSLYMHAAGKSEVPGDFHFWSAISLVAACLQTRVHLIQVDGRIIYPNLYIILMANSGVGKGSAILGQAFDEYASKQNNPEAYEIINPYVGRITMQGLLDYLKVRHAGEKEDGIPVLESPSVWVVQEELKYGVGDKKRAEDFITGLTAMYSPQAESAEGTRTGGVTIIRNPCFNWLAGSNEQWYTDVMGKDSIMTGFGARILFIFGKHDWSKRVIYNEIPKDRKEVVAHLRERVVELCHLSARLRMNEGARKYAEQWYYDREARPDPTDDSEHSIWLRQYATSLKLAIILAVSRDPKQPIITQPDLAGGIKLVETLWESLPRIKRMASMNNLSYTIDCVSYYVKHATRYEDGHLSRTDLLRKMYGNKKRTKDEVDPALDHLKEEGRVEFVRVAGKGRKECSAYRWIEEEESDD